MPTGTENHRVIGVRLDYDPAADARVLIDRFDPGPDDYFAPNEAKELACRVHLGYAAADDAARGVIRRGADWAADYFAAGDPRGKSGGWYGPLSDGLLLALLAGGAGRLDRLCGWATPTKRAEYKGPLEDEVQHLHLVLAGFLQPAPDPRFEKLRARIARCRTRTVRLLSRAVDAVAARDQDGFAAAVADCVRHHATKPRPAADGHFMEDWLPVHANRVYLVGLHLGLARPAFPPEVGAYLMTPESVGFAG